MIPRFSGHETFPCRYAWLPKAYRALRAEPGLFQDEDRAITLLGLGKNMVRSTRFWSEVSGIASSRGDGRYTPTAFGDAILSDRGHDPFLEDIRTLWLLHWKLSSHVEEPLFAWNFLLNHWSLPDFTRSAALRAFQVEAGRLARKLSRVTLTQHFDTFLHSYVPTRSKKGDIQEDNLDCPLVELELIATVGERIEAEEARREPIYAFRRERRATINDELFAFCLDEYWNTRFPSERTLAFQQVAAGVGSPGQVFKMPEEDVRERLERISSKGAGAFEFRDAASISQIRRRAAPRRALLDAVYA